MEIYTRELNLVLKTVERCNINCSYCYYINGRDRSYLHRPVYISQEVVNQLCSFLTKGTVELGLSCITVVIHGGEPLMQKKSDFELICQKLISIQEKTGTKIEIKIQTNGMLIDKEWVRIFCRYNIQVGISIDGNKSMHDKYRVDHRGRGTYERVVEKIHLLISSQYSKTNKVGTITVINPEFSAAEIYRHFVDDLKIKNMNFILPDYDHDQKMPYSAEDFGDYLSVLYNEWLIDNDSSVYVVIIRLLLEMLLGKQSYVFGLGPINENLIPIVTVYSDGKLGPVDDLAVVIYQFLSKYNYSISTISLAEFIKSPIFNYIYTEHKNVNEQCTNCYWYRICAGGALNNRYSKENHFSNPSVYCDGLKKFYENLTLSLIKNGVSSEKIKRNLINLS